jgi:hypothetical protein
MCEQYEGRLLPGAIVEDVMFKLSTALKQKSCASGISTLRRESENFQVTLWPDLVLAKSHRAMSPTIKMRL